MLTGKKTDAGRSTVKTAHRPVYRPMCYYIFQLEPSREERILANHSCNLGGIFRLHLPCLAMTRAASNNTPNLCDMRILVHMAAIVAVRGAS